MEKLASALIKLSKDNLSNLHPHPFYRPFIIPIPVDFKADKGD
jgi:hypothetical protein